MVVFQWDMTEAYWIDLGKKVIYYSMSGCRKREAATVFNIGKDTIH